MGIAKGLTLLVFAGAITRVRGLHREPPYDTRLRTVVRVSERIRILSMTIEADVDFTIYGWPQWRVPAFWTGGNRCRVPFRIARPSHPYQAGLLGDRIPAATHQKPGLKRDGVGRLDRWPCGQDWFGAGPSQMFRNRQKRCRMRSKTNGISRFVGPPAARY